MNFLLECADLLQWGWRVFPLARGEKVPAIPRRDGGRGVLDATDDENIIADWARRYPDANIGVACGKASGILVVDIDPAHGGLDAIRDLDRQGKRFPPTVMVKTANGGWHAYFRYVPGPKNSKSLLGKGIDIRTDGGYVVSPPSCLTGDRRYVWRRRPLGPDLASLPHWAEIALKPREETPFYTEIRGDGGDIESLVIFMQNAPGGERNSILHWCSMRAGESVVRGEVGYQSAFQDMVNAGMSAGLTQDECVKTVKSGMKRGMRR